MTFDEAKAIVNNEVRASARVAGLCMDCGEYDETEEIGHRPGCSYVEAQLRIDQEGRLPVV